jgi:small subunit ribosomal protein S5
MERANQNNNSNQNARFNPSQNRNFNHNRGGGRGREREQEQKKEGDMESVTLITRRVTKVVKGGKKMRFTAMVAVGDRQGQVGVAIAKGLDPRTAIEKATLRAKKNLLKIELKGDTIPFDVMNKFKSSRIFFKPATTGTGIIASNAIRPILELAGIKDIYTKIYGTNNKITNAYCVMEALENFKK